MPTLAPCQPPTSPCGSRRWDSTVSLCVRVSLCVCARAAAAVCVCVCVCVCARRGGGCPATGCTGQHACHWCLEGKSSCSSLRTVLHGVTTRGVLQAKIIKVVHGGTAEAAGIRPGDVIIEIDGRDVRLLGSLDVPWMCVMDGFFRALASCVLRRATVCAMLFVWTWKGASYCCLCCRCMCVCVCVPHSCCGVPCRC